MVDAPLPVGKVPPDILEALLKLAPTHDPAVVVEPGVGMDCAVIRFGGRLLVAKSDPVTFVADGLGDYLVRVNANDIATTGATPRWLLVTLLLPEGRTDRRLAERLMSQIGSACRELTITLVGGHTEITYGLERPIAVGTLLGETDEAELVTPKGAHPGDRVLVTKGVPIEGTAILANEFADTLKPLVGQHVLDEAQSFLSSPGISVVQDATVATAAGRVTAMHDPTEGGIATALWELAVASGRRLRVEPESIPVPSVSRKICEALGIDPLATIASGALLLTVEPDDSAGIIQALQNEGIACTEIGEIVHGPVGLERLIDGSAEDWSVPDRDELARLFDRNGL